MRMYEITNEGVAGPKNCWPGYRKVGTQPGTGKNKGKRVNDCEKIKEQGDNDEDKVAGRHDLDAFDKMVTSVGNKAVQAQALKAQGKEPKTKWNPVTRRYYVDFGDTEK